MLTAQPETRRKQLISKESPQLNQAPAEVPQKKPPFVPPVLTRLGTLKDLTEMFNGMGMDGGSGGMSFP